MWVMCTCITYSVLMKIHRQELVFDTECIQNVPPEVMEASIELLQVLIETSAPAHLTDLEEPENVGHHDGDGTGGSSDHPCYWL